MKKDNIKSSTRNVEMSIIPVIEQEFKVDIEESSLPDNLPILPLRNVAIFPGIIYPIAVGREKSKKLLSEAYEKGSFVGAVPQVDPRIDDPSAIGDMYQYGVAAKVMKSFELPDGTFTVLLQGLRRIRLEYLVQLNPYISAHVTYLEDISPDPERKDIVPLLDSIKERALPFMQTSPLAPKDAAEAIRSIKSLEFMTNFCATSLPVEDFTAKAALLEKGDIAERAMGLLQLLNKEYEMLQLKQEINSKVKEGMDQQQREFYLNSQLRTIQEELGMDEDGDIKKLKEKATTKKWSKEIADTFDKEVVKLERFNPSSPEYSIQFNYLQFMLDLPWEERSQDNMDLSNAQKVLDEDHFGLESVKERIIEYLAVLKLKGDMKSPILCLYGPPGVGKTSLGKSIARALGRKYVRISLGGMHDEAEIRGHRKTYVGALPGRILSGIAKAGTSNPVVVLDEIDKLGSDFKGDPSSALLEALDPEQNSTFHDNYLDLDYDLSSVMFITTANSVSPIQPALLDRMELINVTGYLAEEKIEIAQKFLLPKQLKEHGIPKGALKIGRPALEKIIDEYTHESGVRGLEKQIAKIARVTAKKIALEQEKPATIKPEHLKEYLGLPTAFHDKQQGNELPGVVTGLAWTSMGGEILFVESSVSEGKGVLTMTGNMGNVMKESATIAYQYIKAHPELAEMDPKGFASKDIHVHIPEGATPKDGPSAGITLVSSMVSALRGESIRPGVAMTGEMTLRGRVLPVGGIKEKILAAKRAGVHTIVISQENRKDIEDIKDIYVKGLDFVYVDTIDQVIDYIFSK